MRLAFVPPRVDDELVEWERDAVGEVHFKPLYWTRTPPDTAGWYWVRRIGEREQIALYVGPDDAFGLGGFEWSSSPLPQPAERRR